MILPFFVIIPLLAAFLIALISGDREDWAAILSILSVIILLVLSVYGFFALSETTSIYEMGGWQVGHWKLPVTILLVQDALSAFVLMVVSIIALAALIFAVQYIRHKNPTWKFYALFMLMVTGMNGVIITGDIFNLYVFMEIALFAAYALVAFGGQAEEYEAAFKYAVMGSISSTLILVGIGVLYSATSTLTIARIAELLPGLSPSLTYWVGGIFIAGFGLKAATMPFHAWLPDAHSSAPAPISAMLSGVLIKALGIYVLIRLFFNMFADYPVFKTIFLILGSISILIGSFLALGQWDFKRLLAYSSISQVGYILLGLGLGTYWGVLGAAFHLFNHALFKALLFLNAGSVEVALGTRNLKEMGKLNRIMPVTSATSMVASLSISGIPPFNGFFSKLIIIIAAVQAGLPFYALVAVVGSLLTLAYFMKVQRYGFYGEKIHDQVDTPIGYGMKTAMLLLAVLCIVTSLMVIPGVLEKTLDPIANVILNRAEYIHSVLGR